MIHELINNNCAKIWAFDEMIDRNTENDGNTHELGLTNIEDIIKYATTCLTIDDINTTILNTYNTLLINKNITIFNKDYIIDNIASISGKYYLCGWTDHNIIIFVNKQQENKYEIGIINCGEGFQFHGFNESLCNGIIIFKDISENKILDFFNKYKIYLENTENIIQGEKIFRNFYLMLLKIILNENEVNFHTLRQKHNVEYYKIKKQNIGSCVFTNTINIVYHLFIKIEISDAYSAYLNWYNKIKDIIKEKIYKEIIIKQDINYYNIYKYILDTNKNISNNSEYKTNNNIKQKLYDYNIVNDIKSELLIINRSSQYIVLYNYPNAIYNSTLQDMIISENMNTNIDILEIFKFFYNIKSFDNNMVLLIPLLILYNLKKTKNVFFNATDLKIIIRKFCIKYDYIDTSMIIYICIYILLIKDNSDDSFSEETYYTKNTSPEYKIIQQKNFDYYNYTVFQYIPIINKFYHNIIKVLIKDLYDNIEILPDPYNNIDIENNMLVINDITKKKSLLKYYMIFNKITLTPTSLVELKQYTSKNSINFLLWYIFIYNITDISSDININDMSFDFEVYGYTKYLSDDIPTSNFIINNENDSIEKNPGIYIIYEQKIKLFLDFIIVKLTTYVIDPTNIYLLSEMLKLYIVYFYLCYLNDKLSDQYSPIYLKYNEYIIKYFKDIYYGPFKTIIDIYIYTYDLKYIINKKIFIIDNKTLIPNMEKKFFTLKEYEYSDDIVDNLCSSIIEFYIIYTKDYNLVFNEVQNTLVSINIIKNLLKIENFSIYLILNFYFTEDNGIITGIHKINNKITVELLDSKKIIYTEDTIIYYGINIEVLSCIYYKEFYNLMSHNDNGLFLYKDENKENYYLRTLRYDFLFTMKNSKIYININNINYIVKWCNDVDNYNNYGILKLYTESDEINEVKIICIYNYNNIKKNIDINVYMNFIDKTYISDEETFKSVDLVADEYKLYYYKILDKYNDKIILTNISEVLSLLINCLYYNSPFLILKNIEQIKIILHNNYHDTNYDIYNFNKLLNTLFLSFDNIYSLPILLLFYKKKLNNIYYKSLNIIYNKYDILLRLEETEETEDYTYIKICNNTTDTNYLYFQIKIRDCRVGFDKNKVYFYMLPYDNTLYDRLLFFIEEELIGNILNNEYILNILYKHIEITKDSFMKLIQALISDFNEDSFNININKALELFNYLINPKTKIFNIQELLMGSGKSTVLTSYICILLLNNFLSQYIFINKEIYIVLPESLINSSFITLMKYLFPLFNNIEVLIYPTQKLYTNSYCIYIISDLNYKIMFLEKDMRYIINNMYMIYDEVDMMANPLTCELNKPSELVKLSSVYELFTLSEILYDDIFENNNFWNDIEHKYKNDNHRYIYEINKLNYDKIIEYYNKNIDINKLNSKLVDYVRNNILIFIFTKQFNLDYGMPENYNLDTLHTYKFKAIPYSSVNSPIIGSEFSDPILTYILTLFCYKIMKNKYRKIDKGFIVEYYSKIYEKTFDTKILNILSDFFKIKFDYDIYRNNKKYYMEKYADTFIINPNDFKIIITKILEMNITYYKKCKNISFNDLLLSKNVVNFICFTGTAYINPPKNYTDNVNFDETDFITRSMIKNKIKKENIMTKLFSWKKKEEIVEQTVEQTVENIIKNENIMKNIYNNKDSNYLIKNIFACLKSYDVLIDIGGVFISYDITKFINEYNEIKSEKKYIVYFDNGRKVKNLQTGQFETDKLINKNKKDTFYFFSNKDITGVDVKDIMNPSVHALVVITNKTNMRDFSQGIFRMRCLLDDIHETFDIVFDKLFVGIIQTGGCTKLIKNKHKKIRMKIIKNLIYQQKLINEKKDQALTKQNIFALIKDYTNESEDIDLFIDPTSDEYQIASNKFDEFKNYINNVLILPTNYTFNIDNNNISNILKVVVGETTLINIFIEIYKISDNFELPNNKVVNIYKVLLLLIKKYFLSGDNKILSEIKTNTTQQIEENTEMQQSVVTTNNNIKIIGKIDPDFNYINIHDEKINITDQLLCLYKFDDILARFINKYDILLIYCKLKNTLVILSTDQLMRFLMYNNDILNYTFISLYNNSQYGLDILEKHKKYLISQSLEIFKNNIGINSKYLNQLISYLSINISDTPEDNTELKKINLNFNFSYMKSKLFYIKYIKYKNKYLNLIKKNS